MLEVVIHGVDAVIAWHPARKQFVEFIESDGDPIEGFAGPRGREKLANRRSDGGRGTYLNGVRNVVIVTAMIVHPTESKLLGRRTPCTWFSFPRFTGGFGAEPLEYVKDRERSIDLEPAELRSDATRQYRIPQPETASEGDAQGDNPEPGMRIKQPALAGVLRIAGSCRGRRHGRRSRIGCP